MICSPWIFKINLTTSTISSIYFIVSFCGLVCNKANNLFNIKGLPRLVAFWTLHITSLTYEYWVSYSLIVFLWSCGFSNLCKLFLEAFNFGTIRIIYFFNKLNVEIVVFYKLNWIENDKCERDIRDLEIQRMIITWGDLWAILGSLHQICDIIRA